jgi:hypothetical protein
VRARLADLFHNKLENMVIALIGGKAYVLCPVMNRMVQVIDVSERPLVQE